MNITFRPEGLYFSGRTWGIELHERWSQFLRPKKYNWLDFDLFHLGFEIDRTHGEFNLDLTVLGLYLHFGFVYNMKQNKLSFEKYDKELKRLFAKK